jgi:hypothetical protein
MAKSSSHAKTARPGAASASGAPKRTVVTFSIDSELLGQLDAAAKREERSRSNQIALLIRRFVEGRQQ